MLVLEPQHRLLPPSRSIAPQTKNGAGRMLVQGPGRIALTSCKDQRTDHLSPPPTPKKKSLGRRKAKLQSRRRGRGRVDAKEPPVHSLTLHSRNMAKRCPCRKHGVGGKGARKSPHALSTVPRSKAIPNHFYGDVLT